MLDRINGLKALGVTTLASAFLLGGCLDSSSSGSDDNNSTTDFVVPDRITLSDNEDDTTKVVQSWIEADFIINELEELIEDKVYDIEDYAEEGDNPNNGTFKCQISGDAKYNIRFKEESHSIDVDFNKCKFDWEGEKIKLKGPIKDSGKKSGNLYKWNINYGPIKIEYDNKKLELTNDWRISLDNDWEEQSISGGTQVLVNQDKNKAISLTNVKLDIKNDGGTAVFYHYEIGGSLDLEVNESGGDTQFTLTDSQRTEVVIIEHSDDTYSIQSSACNASRLNANQIENGNFCE